MAAAMDAAPRSAPEFRAPEGSGVVVSTISTGVPLRRWDGRGRDRLAGTRTSAAIGDDRMAKRFASRRGNGRS
jgi:hypothetical protein